MTLGINELLVHSIPDRFELLAAKEVFEVRPKGITKGYAVELLMNQERFSGRRLVFVGDDVTDEDGMEAPVPHSHAPEWVLPRSSDQPTASIARKPKT